METYNIYKELQSLIDDLHCDTNELIRKRQNHELNRVDIDNAYDKIKDHMEFIHQLFIKYCYEIINNVYNSHQFELASIKNLEIIKQETQQELYKFINTFKDELRPNIIYEIIFNIEPLEERKKIKDGYEINYLTINNIGNIHQNIYYMKKYILELFGFDINNFIMGY